MHADVSEGPREHQKGRPSADPGIRILLCRAAGKAVPEKRKTRGVSTPAAILGWRRTTSLGSCSR